MAPYPDRPAPADEYLALVLDADLRLLAITERLRQHWSAHATALGLTAARRIKALVLTPEAKALPAAQPPSVQRVDVPASFIRYMVLNTVGPAWPLVRCRDSGDVPESAEPGTGRGEVDAGRTCRVHELCPFQ
jgi:hypothetical protein